MVEVVFDPNFKRIFKRIRSKSIKTKFILQIAKIKRNPEIGKPMRFVRKGTREIYVKPYRLSYCVKKEVIYLLDIYHKDMQ